MFGEQEAGRFIPVLPDQTVIIGRSRECDIQILDSLVSHKHIQIVWIDGSAYVEDLKSQNGTFLDEKLIEAKALLSPETLVRIGDTVFRWVSLPAKDTPTTRQSRPILTVKRFLNLLDCALVGPGVIAITAVSVDPGKSASGAYFANESEIQQMLERWILSVYPVEPTHVFGRLNGEWLLILHLSGEYLEAPVDLALDGVNRDALSMRLRQIGAIRAGIARAFGQIRDPVRLVHRAVSATERRRNQRPPRSWELSYTTSKLNINREVIVEVITRSSLYVELLAISLTHSRKSKIHERIPPSDDLVDELERVVVHNVKEDDLVFRSEDWLFVAAPVKHRVESIAHVVSEKWTARENGDSLEVVWASNDILNLRQINEPLEFLVRKCLNEMAWDPRVAALPFANSQWQHSERNRQLARGVVHSKLTVVEFSQRFLAACFFGVLQKYYPRLAELELARIKECHFSSRSWFFLAARLGLFLKDDVPLKDVAREFRLANIYDELKGVLEYRDRRKILGVKIQEEISETEKIDSLLDILDTFFKTSFPESRIFGVVEVEARGNSFVHTIRELDRAALTFTIDELEWDTPLKPHWLYLLIEDDELICLAPFFFIQKCKACKRDELFAVSQFDDPLFVRGKSMTTGHVFDYPVMGLFELLH